MDFYADKIAARLGGKNFGIKTEVYKFERIKQAKDEARRKHPDVALIDLGVGEPDEPANSNIVSLLYQEAGKPENRFYSDNGIPEFREAAADYLAQIYNLKGVDPHKNILHGIGSKPILAMLPICLINPGDIALATIPGYPVTSTYTRYMGGEVYQLPLLKENAFYPDFTSIPQNILERAKLLYINYPNNPTGQVATREFYQKVVEFAHQNNVVVICDAAYGAVVFDDYQPLSILSLDGAIDVCVEVHSLSKAFNMTGWRLGFVVGSSKIIEAYGVVKDNSDSGQFRAIQKAGIHALSHPEWTLAQCEKYSRRFDLLVEVLNEVGFRATKPKASFYCYVQCPRGAQSGVVFKNAGEAADFLIKEAQISTVPWDDAGPYLRFSVTFEAEGYQAEKKVMQELSSRLSKLQLLF